MIHRLASLAPAAVLVALPLTLPQDAQHGGSAGSAGARRRHEIVPPQPTLDAHVGVTAAAGITLSGQAPDALGVEVRVGEVLLHAPASPSFSVDVPLDVPDHVYSIEVRSVSITRTRSAPALTTVVRDDSGPELVVIDQPLEGASPVATTVDVSGRVADALSGVEGLQVVVNGVTAEVTPANDTQATFVARGVSLNAVGVQTPLVATATDAVNHSSMSAARTVTQAAAPPATPRLELTSPTGTLTGQVHTLFAQPITAHVTTDGSTAFAGKVVTFHMVGGDGRLSAAPSGAQVSTLGVLTDASGNASAWFTLGSAAGSGNHCVDVGSVGTTGGGVVCLSATLGDVDQLNITSGNDQQGEVGTVVAQPLRVRLSAGGAPVTGAQGGSVKFTVAQGGGSLDATATVTMATVPTDGTGHAQVPFRLGPTQGLNRIRAEVAGPTIPANPPLATFNLNGFVRNTGGATSLGGVVLDDADEPIQGATLELWDGSTVVATGTSDLSGRFLMDGLGVDGALELRVDGSMATVVGGPNGSAVPTGSFPEFKLVVSVVDGQTNELPAPVHLPFLDPVNARVFDNSQDVVLGMAGVEGFSMTIPAGSMSLPGQVVDPAHPVTVSVNQIHFDRSPVTLPDGADNYLLWLLEPADATFDPPIDLRLPNIAGLEPGSTGHLLALNEQDGSWVVTTNVVVSEGGNDLGNDIGAAVDRSGAGGFVPPYHPFLDVTIPNVTPADEIPTTAWLPVPGGTIRSDACGSGCFGAPRGTRLHAGVDLEGVLGVTNVVSVYAGTVVGVQADCLAGPGCDGGGRACGGGYGNFVVVEHTPADVPAASVRFYTAYAHLATVLVAEGTPVAAGAVLGTLGETGNADPDCQTECGLTPFVHFEISPQIPPLNGLGPLADPRDYLDNLGTCPSAPAAPGSGPVADGDFAATLALQALGRDAVATGNALDPMIPLVEINNVPYTEGARVAVQGTWLVGDDFERSYRSEFLGPLSGDEHTTVPILALDRGAFGQPESVALTVDHAVIDTTMADFTAQLTAIATNQAGATKDVTAGTEGTYYSSSNDAIATVDAGGLVTAGTQAGTALVAASNEGITAVVSVDVLTPGALTTVYGFVERGGFPTGGVTVTVLPGNQSAVSSSGPGPFPEGWFEITDVPADAGLLTVFAELDDMGGLVAGAATGILPVPEGLTDAGIVSIDDAVVWVTDGSGDWDDPTNWSTNPSIPQAGDVVVIDVPSAARVTIDANSPVVEVLALRCEEELEIATGASLEVTTPFQVNAAFELNGGTLASSTVLSGTGDQGLAVTEAGGTLDAVALLADAMILDGATSIVTNGLRLEGTMSLTGTSGLTFSGAQELSGQGEIDLAAIEPNLSTILAPSGTLTIGERMTIRGASAQIGLGGHTFVNRGLIQSDSGSGGGNPIYFQGTYVNHGTMRARSAPLFMVGSGACFLTNHGAIEVEGSFLVAPDNPWTNLGTVTGTGGGVGLRAIVNDGVVSVDGGWLTLGQNSPDVDWTNENGVITGNAIYFWLDGHFTLTELGQFEPVDGNVEIGGDFDLEGQELAVDWPDPRWRLRPGAIVRNGAVVGIGAGGLHIGHGVVAGTITLDSVDLHVPTWVEQETTLILSNGLTLENTLRLKQSTLQFDGDAVFDGSGTVLVDSGGPGGEARISAPTGTLAIGPNLVVFDGPRTLRVGGPGQTISSEATIRADSSVGTVVLEGAWTNAGLFDISANGSISSVDTCVCTGTIALLGRGVFTAPVLDLQGGTLSGQGSVVGDVLNASGAVHPAPSFLSVSGDYTQTEGAEMLVDLASASTYGRLNVGGTVDLGGVLVIETVGTYAPPQGTEFALMSAADVVGAFATMMPPADVDLLIDHRTASVNARVLAPGAKSWLASIVAGGTAAGSDSSNSALRLLSPSTVLVAFVDEDDQEVRFARSIDGGRSWALTVVHGSIGQVPAGISLAVGDDDTYFVSYYTGGFNGDVEAVVSEDGGATWSTPVVIKGQTGPTETAVDAVDALHAVVAYFDMGTLRLATTADAGMSWRPESADPLSDGAFVALRTLDVDRFFLGYAASDNMDAVVATTDDGGDVWEHVRIDSSGQDGDYISLDTVDGDRIFVAYQQGSAAYRFARSDDGGASWTPEISIDSGAPTGDFADLVAANATDVFVSFQRQHQHLWMGRSSDAGASWETFLVDDTVIDVGKGTAIGALDAGQVFVTYYDVINQRVKLLRSVPE